MWYKIIDNKLNSYADHQFAEDCLETDIITQAELDEHQDKVIVQGGVLVLNPNYEQEQKLKEREDLDELNVTRGDVFEALILARQITKVQIREMIVQNVVDQMQQALMLNRFDEALNYYRGYPIFDMLGAIVGITSEQWDNYFIKATNEETKADAYKELLSPKEVMYGEEEEVVDG